MADDKIGEVGRVERDQNGNLVYDVALFKDPEPKRKRQQVLPGRIYENPQMLEDCPFSPTRDGKHKWIKDPEKGIWACTQCMYEPKAFIVDLGKWQENPRLKVFYDDTGQRLDSYSRTITIRDQIRKEMEDGTFEPKRYSKRRAKELYLPALMDEFFQMKLDRKRLAPSYVKDFKRFCETHKEYKTFQHKKIGDLTSHDMDLYEVHLRQTHPEWSGTYIGHHMEHLAGFFRWLLKKKRAIKEMPEIEPVKKNTPKEFALAKKAQIQVLSTIDDEMDREFVRCGMLHTRRPCEIAALTKRQVDIFGKVLRIDQHFSGNELLPGLKGREDGDTIPINLEQMKWFRKRVGQLKNEDDWIFENPRNRGRKGKNYPFYTSGTRMRLWNRARKATDLDPACRLYDGTRHSALTLMALAGVPESAISEQAGHTSRKSTQRYIHKNMDRQREYIATLSLQTANGSKVEVKKKRKA